MDERCSINRASEVQAANPQQALEYLATPKRKAKATPHQPSRNQEDNQKVGTEFNDMHRKHEQKVTHHTHSHTRTLTHNVCILVLDCYI